MDSQAVHAVARLALVHTFTEEEIAAVVASFDVSRLRGQLAALGLCEPDISAAGVAKLYFSRRCCAISPNAFFDETWYVQHYADVRDAIRGSGVVSGFVHFVKEGLRTGRWPNPLLLAASERHAAAPPPRDTIDEAQYLAANPEAAAFLGAFPSLAPLEHYNLYGRFLGYAPEATAPKTLEALTVRAAEAEFDPDFYTRTYLSRPETRRYAGDPFGHYVRTGMRLAYSPNAWFQEDFYRAFYKDVRDAIREGWLPSGFYHYVITGRAEGRIPAYDLSAALEARIPGITDPSLLPRADMLKTRLQGLKSLPACVETQDRPRMIWLLLPNLNPDIMYGGFRAAVELVCALRRDGHSVGIVCVDEPPNAEYFLWAEKSARVRDVFSAIPLLSLESFVSGTIGPDDLFIAYTVWDLKAAAQLAARTDHKLPLLLAQEYEPIFYANGAQRALCEACYRIPHYPIINSSFLLSYLARHRLGVFGGTQAPRPGAHYAVFEHRINKLPSQTARGMAARKNRVCAIYARPEAHAARNVLEIIVMALQELCEREVFGPEWSFVGLGALSKIPPVTLGGGHELKLLQKLPEDEYRQLMSEMDIGLSLMYAPHPSVVPFEFATTGAIVVTNTYENRSAEQLRQICGNIVPCELSVESLADALITALERVEQFDQRESHIYRPPASSWDAVFSHGFLSTILTNVVNSAAEDRPTVVEFPSIVTAPARPEQDQGKMRRRVAVPTPA